MVFNNGAVIPGKRVSIRPVKKTVQKPANQQQLKDLSVSVADIPKEESKVPVVITDVNIPEEPILKEEPTQEQIDAIIAESLASCPYAMVDTIIPESPIEEEVIMEEIKRDIEEEFAEDEEQEEEIEQEEDRKDLPGSFSYGKKKNKKNKKKKAIEAFEPEQEG